MKKFMFLTIALVVSSLGIFAQAKPVKKDSTQHMAMYTCPMHPDVTSDKPGKCPKCGMALVAKKEPMKAGMAKVYTCPMHPDVTSSKPGKCPKCGMDLVEKKKAPAKKMKMDSTMKM